MTTVGISSKLTAAAALNLALDWLLIFGTPRHAAAGPGGCGIATTSARFVKITVILVSASAAHHLVALTRLADLHGAGVRLLRRFLAVALPLTITELLWVLGDAACTVVRGRMGTDSLAAMAMTFPVQSLSIGSWVYVGLFAISGHIRHMGPLCLLGSTSSAASLMS